MGTRYNVVAKLEGGDSATVLLGIDLDALNTYKEEMSKGGFHEGENYIVAKADA